MKCPKCGYVGFEAAEKCRNCGYRFSLMETAEETDLPLKGDDADEAIVPPVDLRYTVERTPNRVERRPGPRDLEVDLPPRPPRKTDARPPDADLPLFGGTSDRGARRDAAPSNAISAAPTPRQASPSPRVRPRAATPSQPKPGTLGFDGDPARELVAAVRSRSTTALPAAQPAGSIARAIAGIIDAAILGGLDLGVLYFTLRVCRLSFSDVSLVPISPLIAFFLLVDGAYLVAFTATGGQTIGKMAASIRVIGEDGNRVAFGQAFVRSISYLASVLPAGLGFVPGLIGPTRRALHDRVANTRVVQV